MIEMIPLFLYLLTSSWLPPSDYQTGNYGDKTDGVLAKANPNFLDNLNAKLAEQHATNKANAVRSYINSKVVVSRF